MERTEVFELTTEQDVQAFCQFLLEGKELAPVSLRYTVALTVHRLTKVLAPYDEKADKRGPIESGFHSLQLR